MDSVTDALDTPAGVLADVTVLRAASRRAEQLLLQRAALWADLHPPVPGAPQAFRDGSTLPGIAWDAAAELAAALGMTTRAGEALIEEALELRHRLPRVWAQVTAGVLEAWRARRIAQATLDHPDDVVAYIDEHVHAVAHKIGQTTLGRLLDEARLLLDAEAFLEQRWEELDHRYARLDDHVSHGGIGTMTIAADLADLLDLDEALATLARHMADHGDPDSLDVRRAKAIGILADPAAALALLEEAPATDDTTAPDDKRGRRAARRRYLLHVHVTDAVLAGHDTVARIEERGGRPMLADAVREWLGHPDAHITVLPVRDLGDHHAVGHYEIPDRLRQQAALLQHTCVFPWCERPAVGCDCDHTVPFAAGGTTCSCNLAPLCRRHHRYKTHTGWAYTPLDPTTFLWTSPHGRQYLRDETGSIDATRPARPAPGDAPPGAAPSSCLVDRGS